jgi:predicted aldo/keto reductase-like oxidoreductase
LNAAAPLPKRPYKDGIELSIIGFGGIVATAMPQEEADRRVAAAYDRGVNYYDVAPTYANGEAETKLGNALRPYRAKVFLAEKTTQRSAKGARMELERSLERLHTDHFDLYQFHAVSSMKDADEILGPGGAAETFLKAKQEGKVRYLGLSAHNEEAAIKVIDALKLDSVLFPVNFAAWSTGGFGERLLKHAKSKGMARMALKAMAYGAYPQGTRAADRKFPKCWYQPIEDRELAALALRFTLSQDITAAIPPGDERFFDLALELAPGFKRITAAERETLFAKAKSITPVFKS